MLEVLQYHKSSRIFFPPYRNVRLEHLHLFTLNIEVCEKKKTRVIRIFVTFANHYLGDDGCVVCTVHIVATHLSALTVSTLHLISGIGVLAPISHFQLFLAEFKLGSIAITDYLIWQRKVEGRGSSKHYITFQIICNHMKNLQFYFSCLQS